MSNWKKFPEEKPLNSGRYLVVCGQISFAIYVPKTSAFPNGIWKDETNPTIYQPAVTHWMELPPLP